MNFPVSEEPSPTKILENTKFKLLLWMSLVFRASTNVCFSGNNLILKFYIKGSKNLPSSSFFNSENLLLSYEQCTGSFIQTFKTRWEVIMVLPLHMKEITWKRTVYLFFLFIFLIIIIILIIIVIIIIIIIIIPFKFFTLFSK